MDNGHIEIAKSLMKEIMYEAGVVDRYNPEAYTEKWVNKIAPIAGKFFELNPELLTNERIEEIGSGFEDGILEFYNHLEGWKELDEVLNDYLDHI